MRDIPYFSQWADPAWTDPIVNASADPCDDPSWTTRGFPDAERYRFWAQRLCGIACLESVLAYWQIARPSRYDLLEACLTAGVYVLRDDGSVHGLIYQPFAEWARHRFGIAIDVVTNASCSAFARAIPADGFGIASVGLEIRTPHAPNPSRGGHLVLLHQVEDDRILFHNPSGVAPHQANACLGMGQFDRFFAGRGMIVRRGDA